MDLQARSDLIKKEAALHGFDFCGISKAGYLEEEADRLEQWLTNDYHGKMRYMENHFDKRLDPTKLVPGSKSVISLIYNYAPKATLPDNDLKIARYAYGEDYHFVVKERLRSLTDQLKNQIGDFHGRVFVDSAPVMERQWAAKSGLGWIGKHSLLINRSMGSYFFLAEMIVDLELVYDGPVKDFCGTCTKCMDACPTDAIADHTVDASRCISYLTIELKDSIPAAFQEKMEGWMFGCDICQEVCPWNRFSSPHQEPSFEPSPWLQDMTVDDWKEITKDVFQDNLKDSPMQRKTFDGIKGTIQFLSNKKTP